MDLGITGMNAIVCASSKGLGRACAHALASNGVNVVINGRDEAALSKTASDLASETGVSVTAVAGDVSDAGVQERLLKTCPAPDILVNNNGGPPFADYRALDREAMLAGVVMNMVTPIELIQRVMDGMMERGFGRIVNITSISVKMPVPGLDLSSGARAGLTAFLAGVVPQAAGRNVTINHILPGYFATERHNNSLTALAKRTGQSPEDALQSRIETVPAKRLGQPDEFGQACAFLCSQHAGYITGQNLLLDGGRFEGTW